MKTIVVKNVRKIYTTPEKPKPGIFNSFLNIFHRRWLKKEILHNISFEINEGEFVGYVGPNGAGKSTTIKLLTGVLTPSSGEISVLGMSPTKDRYKYTYNIGVVFGHRSMLEFNIPVIDSFRLFKAIYELNDAVFEERLKYFVKMLELEELLHVPVRKLSLGQRMRCELAASLLHKPKVIFLDEPTIGLDAVSKEEIRKFLKRINGEEKVTIILTTHDMDDIEELCSRIILIDNGTLMYDGPLDRFKNKYIHHKTVEFVPEKVKDKKKYDSTLALADEVETEGAVVRLQVNIKKHKIPQIVTDILNSSEVIDLSIHTPRLEELIKEVYLKNKE